MFKNLVSDHFKKAGMILLNCQSFIVIAYLIDHFYALLFMPKLGPLAFLFFLPLKICFYAGALGVLIKIVVGEELFIKRDSFVRGVKDLWYIYLIIQIIPACVYFVLAFTFPIFRQVPAQFFSMHMNLPMLFIFVAVVFSAKYRRPNKLKKCVSVIPIRDIIILLVLYGIDLLLVYSPLGVGFKWIRVGNFLSKNIYFLEYIYLGILVAQSYPELEKKFSNEKELYCICPVSGGIIEGLVSFLIKPFPGVFVVLKALTPSDYVVRMFNRCIWSDRYFVANKLVAITCFSSNCAEAYRIAKGFKAAGSTVIMGGPHVTYMSDEALMFCDCVVLGEAEGVWEQIIKDYEKGCLGKKYIGKCADEAVHEKIYQALLASPPAVIKDYLETTRGCKYRCYFCAIPAMHRGFVRQRSIEQMIALLEKVRIKYNQILFLDNNIFSDPVYAKEFFRALIPLKIKWNSQCSLDIARDDEALQLAKESGCKMLLFGYEIAGDSLEKKRGGKFAMADKHIEYTKKIKQAGINIKAHYIFGFESDSWKTLWNLWKYCFKIFPFYTVIGVLTPLPGTQFYADMVDQNKINNFNWRNYFCHSMVFEHKKISSRTLNFFYPGIYFIFLITTSLGGMCIFLIMLVVLISGARLEGMF